MDGKSLCEAEAIQQPREPRVGPQRVEERVVARIDETGIAERQGSLEPRDRFVAPAPLGQDLPLLVEHAVAQLRDQAVHGGLGSGSIVAAALDERPVTSAQRVFPAVPDHNGLVGGACRTIESGHSDVIPIAELQGLPRNMLGAAVIDDVP